MSAWPWLSLDLATLSGFTQWIGNEPVAVGHIRPKGSLGKWVVSWQAVRNPVSRAPTDFDGDTCGEITFEPGQPGEPLAVIRPWMALMKARPRLVIAERPFGKFRKADASLAERRGLVLGLAAREGARLEILNTGTWRRVATESWGCSWLSDGDTERLKNTSISLVREHYGWHVAVADEAEALLVGHAALRTRVVDITTDGWGVGARPDKPARTKSPRKSKSAKSAPSSAPIQAGELADRLF